MLDRINCFKIIKDHIGTLRDLNSNRSGIYLPDLLLFFIFPVTIALALAYYNCSLIDHITDFITAISIIGGFLFNLLAIIYGLMEKLNADAVGDRLKSIFVSEVHINISFNILVSFVLLVTLIIYSYFIKVRIFYLIHDAINFVLTSLIYFLIIVFALTMLMILNRIYILLKKG